MVWSPFKLRISAEESLQSIPALRAAAEKVAASITHGPHTRSKSGSHEVFWQYREYHNSDRPQDIDWRQSAKTDAVYVREKELQTPQSYYIWCNRSRSMDFHSDNALHSKAEAAQILSLALALLLERGDEQVGFLNETRVSRSEAGLDKIAQSLLRVSEDALPQGRVDSHARMMMVGDFLSPLDDLRAAIDPFSARHIGGVLIQVLDPAEIALPYSGHVVFEGLEVLQKIDNVTAIRDDYRDRIHSHIKAVETLCDDFDWDYHLHSTDMPLEKTLMNIWEGLQR